MLPRTSTNARRRGASRARLVMPMAGLGLLCASVAMLLHNRTPSGETVSQVARRIQQIALTSGGGELGPWLVSAEHVDPLSGTLLRLRIESGPMIIAAERATLVVNADDNTFSFELSEVVFTRVPDDEDGEAGVHTLDTHMLGPAPWGMDIVPDAEAPPKKAPSSWVQAE
jgi:hypothetical protein